MSIVVSVAIVIIFQKTLYFTFLSLPKNWGFPHFIPVRIKIPSEILWSYFSNNTRCDTLTQSLLVILINTFKLIGLVGPNINISNRYIKLNNFLLAKTYKKCIFSHFCEKLLNLINGAITYICDCIYVNLYMVFIT
jgi:hypothetical protein